MNLFSQLLLSLVAAALATFALLQVGLDNAVVALAIVSGAVLLTPLVNYGLGGGNRALTGADELTSDDEREEGEVKWFNVSKGFGFIRRESGEEIFVHFRSIRSTGGKRDGRRGLKDGQRVSFVVTDSDKGPQAEDVQGL